MYGFSDESMRLPPPIRRALNRLVDNEIYRSEVQLGRIDEYRSYKQFKKVLLEDEFYSDLLEMIQLKLIDKWCKEQVQNRIDHTYDDYELTPEQFERLPEKLQRVFEQNGKQRRFVRIDNGSEHIPKRVKKLSTWEHRRVGEQRQQKIAQLENPRNWHFAVAAAGEELGIENGGVVEKLFEIRRPEDEDEDEV